MFRGAGIDIEVPAAVIRVVIDKAVAGVVADDVGLQSDQPPRTPVCNRPAFLCPRARNAAWSRGLGC